MTAYLQQSRTNMIEQQIRTWDVLDNAVLSLYDDIRRADFVAAAALKDLAYADVELPIGHGQFMLEPKLEARMLQTLALHKHEEVLHIGTGSGFFCSPARSLDGESGEYGNYSRIICRSHYSFAIAWCQ
jgi:protein-L-isoaspartate(D-aspartate) O-methyltransferase